MHSYLWAWPSMHFVEVFGPWLLGRSQDVCGPGHVPLISPHDPVEGIPIFHRTFGAFSSRGTWMHMDYVVGICIRYLLGLVTVSFVETWEIILSSLILPSSAFLAPRNQCPLKAPGETKAPGWPRIADCVFECSCTFWEVNLVVCFMLSCIYPPTTFTCFFFLIFFFFHFLAACHRNDTHSANSALDSMLQTRTTNSPVREQSERKMKNNIRKEPFGKLHKKCYIKIDTRAWPFVVLYILKPSIDSLLITCLF